MKTLTDPLLDTEPYFQVVDNKEHTDRASIAHFFRYLMAVIICLTTLYPRAVDRDGLRSGVTVLAGLLVYSSSMTYSQPNKIINIALNVLEYLGDISYSLYLIHWPVVLLIRYWTSELLDLQSIRRNSS